MPMVGDRRNPYPPPAGVLYFLIHDEERREKGYKFPSPLGELYFLMCYRIAQENFCDCVSVPSRGAIFLNKSNNVPVRTGPAKFPSPLGELYFLISLNKLTCLLSVSFPSPLGELYFLILSNSFSNLTFLFPSPLGELYFLMKHHRQNNQADYSVSVPSRGAIFLNFHGKRLYSSGSNVSVPSRGAIFLNGK